jgi:hypothetical protein
VRDDIAGLREVVLAMAEGDRTTRDVLTSIASRPPGPTREDLAAVRGDLEGIAAVQRSIDDLRARPPAATPDDLQLARDAVLEALAAQIAAVRSAAPAVEQRGDDLAPVRDDLAVLRRAVADLDQRAAELADAVRAQAVAGDASRDAAEAGFASVRSDLALLRQAAEGIDALRTLAERSAGGAAGLDGVSHQLDAVGQLVSHVLTALHRVEEGTVGLTPAAQRRRASSRAAIERMRRAAGTRIGAAPDADM